MLEKIGEYFQKALAFWGNLDKKKKLIGAAVGVGLVLSLAAAALIFPSSKVKIYDALGVAEAAKVVATLNGLGINASLGTGGGVVVPQKDAAAAVMQLSVEGFDKPPYDYSLFKDGNSILSSDSEKRAYLLFQLQDRIEHTIRSIQGIEAAVVNLALPESSSFVLEADKPQASASVTIKFGGLGGGLSPKQIAGIKLLVASAVPGLDVANVTVVDNYGNILESSEGDGNKDSDLSRMEERVDNYTRKKLLTVLEPMFGKGNVEVSVKSSVNYESKETKETTYSPVIGENGVLQHRDETSETASSAKSQPTNLKPEQIEKPDQLAEDNAEEQAIENKEITTYQEAEEKKENSSSEKRDVSEDFLVNKREEQIVKRRPTVESISVAVTINRETMTEQERAGLTRMLAAAAGVSEDDLVVYNMKFTSIQGLDRSMTLGEFLKTPLGNLVSILGGLVVLLAGAVIVFLVRSRKARNKGLLAPDVGLADGLGLTKKLAAGPVDDLAEGANASDTGSEGGEHPGQEGLMDADMFNEIKGSDPTEPQGDRVASLATDSPRKQDLSDSDEELQQEQGEVASLLGNVENLVSAKPEVAATVIRNWNRAQ
ncbi:MAG: hypothetical protein LBJ38_02440 [Oscillospiraceae bacterium]|jgi:flagellar M-ring protein FliF|nr:hypothetical protein [Oscillospiraceae bacterium]